MCEAWESYFEELGPIIKGKESKLYGGKEVEINHDTPLNDSYLYNPDHPVSQTMLYLYTIDSWLFSVLNSGSKEGDQAKMETLGPYAYAFGGIIECAAKRRTDIPAMKKLLEETGTKLYRGTGLTKNELKEYKDKVGSKIEKFSDGYFKTGDGYMTMTGFISTSMNRSDSQKFAWSNDKTGH